MKRPKCDPMKMDQATYEECLEERRVRRGGIKVDRLHEAFLEAENDDGEIDFDSD